MKYIFSLLIFFFFFVLSHNNKLENPSPKDFSQYTDPLIESIQKTAPSPTVKPTNEILPKLSTVVSPLEQNITVGSCFKNECSFKGSCVEKPENAYCVLDNPKNAWLCDYGFLEQGNACVSLEQGCPTNTCKFKGKCIDKPDNAYCITETATDAWKCLFGYNDTGKDCVLKTPSTVSYSNVYTGSNLVPVNNITERNTNKYYCQNLTTAEAYSLFLRGHTYLDADNDGIPCEWESSNYSNYYYTPIPTYKSSYTYPSSGLKTSCHYVKAYTRSNGTRVSGYTRCR